MKSEALGKNMVEGSWEWGTLEVAWLVGGKVAARGLGHPGVVWGNSAGAKNWGNKELGLKEFIIVGNFRDVGVKR